ncbi:hypothetical protein O9993_05745 [Vibrio lentus]|nr:hypothetical protein [Vibrio lentus]
MFITSSYWAESLWRLRATRHQRYTRTSSAVSNRRVAGTSSLPFLRYSLEQIRTRFNITVRRTVRYRPVLRCCRFVPSLNCETLRHSTKLVLWIRSSASAAIALQHPLSAHPFGCPIT